MSFSTRMWKKVWKTCEYFGEKYHEDCKNTGNLPDLQIRKRRQGKKVFHKVKMQQTVEIVQFRRL